MSGFLAMLDLAGDPVDERLLARLAKRMTYRGPHGCSVATFGAMGLAHSLLRTGDAAHDEPQPRRIGEGPAIVGDARIDDRGRLLSELAAATGEEDFRPGTAEAVADTELILRSYACWGNAAVERLLGDFAFAIWDPERQRLFCARDQFGVKPLYFATYGNTFLASNSLRCLRGHPAADDRLDERAMADYLIFSFNRHADRSAFAGIRRLPPAHTLTLDPSAAAGSGAREPVARRYWTLPIGSPLRFHRDEDYLDRFRELIEAAVADRTRESRIGVLMSGGIDSTTVAATASALPGRQVEAFTYGYTELVDDDEPDYAALAASAIGIRLHRLALDADRTRELWGSADAATPAPMAVPMTRRMDAFFRESAPGTRVGLTGQGADPGSHLLPEDASSWLRRHPLEATWQAWRYRRRYGRFPRAGLRTAMRRRISRATLYRPVYPPWLPAGLEKRLDLRARFERFQQQPPTGGAVRPLAHAILASSDLSSMLESYDPGYTKFAADVRHPWLDLRLVDFMLRLPPIPWCVEKHIVRAAMASRLPRATLVRRKSSLPDYPIMNATLTDRRAVSELAASSPRLAEYVDISRLQGILRKPERLRTFEYEVVTRPLGVALWLRQFEDGPANR